MAPFHPLRHSARALFARAGAAFAVFLTIAAILLAGGSEGPLSSAEATGGDSGSIAVEPAASEAPPVDPAIPPEPVEPAEPVVDEPVTEEPVVEEPPVDEPPVEEPPVEESPAEEPPAEEPEGENPSGGSKGGGTETTDPAGGKGEGSKPTGGSKGSDPNTEQPGSEEGEPAPSSRPQVTPDTEGESGGGGGEGGTGDTPAQAGNGRGNLQDTPDQSAPGEGNDIEAAGRDTSGAGEGTDGAADGGTAGATEGDTPGTGPDAGTGTTDTDAGGGAQGEGGQNGSGNGNAQDEEGQNIALQLIQPFQDAASYVPDSIKAALAALAALSILLAFGYLLSALRARRLSRQRRELLQEVGLLQSALLPPVPDKVGALRTSVAYRPADGPGAGGDFYDVLPLPGGRVGFILGDVSGHGRGALARTAFMRYTLRAYLEAGLEPRVALQVAGRVIDDNLGGDFATVLLAVHDPETGSLTYATAGHPAPIVVGPQPHDPVTAGSSPPIGVGVRTGLRQTTVPLVPGSVACLFTDGLMEARTEDGILGRERLAELLDDLGDEASARRLIERVAAESSNLSDDMAAVIVSPTAGVTAGLFRTEQLELSARELEGPIARRFLEACGLPAYEVEDAEHDARLLADRFGGVVLHVVFGNRLRVEVLPRNVESIEAASRRVSAGSAQ